MRSLAESDWLRVDGLVPDPGRGVPADAGAVIRVEDAGLIFRGDYLRDGADLVITGGGHRLVVHDYFLAPHRPKILAPNGASLTDAVIEALARPAHGTQVAQAGAPAGADPGAPIGRVQAATGSASAVRNGVTVALHTGDLVYKGDVVQTDRASSLSIAFLDGTVFSVAASARMVMNDLVYRDGAADNHSLFSLVQGSVSFVAGKVAKTGDMKVGTPVATMGIRGTAVKALVEADDGTSRLSVMTEPPSQEYPGGHTGRFDVYDSTDPNLLLATVDDPTRILVVRPRGSGGDRTETLSKSQAEIVGDRQIVQTLYQTRADTPSLPIPNGPNTGGGGTGSGTAPNQILPNPPGTPGEPGDRGPGGSGPFNPGGPAPGGTQAPERAPGSSDPPRTDSPADNPSPFSAVPPGATQPQAAASVAPTASGTQTSGTQTSNTQTVAQAVTVAAVQAATPAPSVQTAQASAPATATTTETPTTEPPAKAADTAAATPPATTTTTTATTPADTQKTAGATSGRVVDGYVRDALVFADANGNDVLDPGEVSTRSDAGGNFTLVGGSGTIIAIGGTDISTGLPNLITLRAPAGATFVTPLTSLVLGMGGSAEAVARVAAAFGLAGIDLSSFDPYDAAASGSAAGRTAYLAGVAVADTALLLATALVGQGVGADAAYAAVLRQIAAAGPGAQAVVDLADAAFVRSVLTGAASALHVSLTRTAIDAAVAGAAASNGQLASIAETGQALLPKVAAVEAGVRAQLDALTSRFAPPTVDPATALDLGRDGTGKLSGDNLKASAPSGSGTVSYTVVGDPHGTFVDAGGKPVTTFTQADIDGGAVVYRHAGSAPITGVETLTFLVTTTGGGSATVRLAVNVPADNHAPVVAVLAGDSAGPATPLAARTDSDAAGPSATGTLTVTDADPGDRLTVTTSFLGYSGPARPQDLSEARLTGSFSAALAAPGAHGLTWVFDPGEQGFQYLAQGETATLRYSVRATDDSGAADDAGDGVVTIEIQGRNAAPVFDRDAGTTGTAAERGGSTGSTEPDTASGTLSFTDANRSDTHAAKTAPALQAGSVRWLKADGTAAGDPAAVAGLMSALAGAAQAGLVDDSGDGRTGHAAWSVTLPDGALDFLGSGETLTARYDVTVTDPHGGAAVQAVTATFTGTNDAPVIAAPAPRLALAEADGRTGSTDLDTATGSVGFADPDLTDTHAVAVTATPTLSVSRGPAAPAGLAAALTGALTASLDEAGHRIGYGFAAADGLFDFLAAGQTLTATYDLAISDGRGGTTHAPVAVTVTGTDDAPVASDAAFEAPANRPLAGRLTVTDVDSTQLTYAVQAGPAHGTLFVNPYGSFLYTPAAGYHGDDGFTFRAGDGLLQSNTATVSIAVPDRAPVITSQQSQPTNVFATPIQDGTGAPLHAAGVIAFADADVSDTHTVTRGLLSVTARSSSGGSLDVAPSVRAALDAALTVQVGQDGPGNAGAGTVSWAFDLADATAAFLGQGASLTARYTVLVSDGYQTASTTVSVIVNGTNDAPVIAAPAPGLALAEADGRTGSTDLDTVTGSVDFTDPDPTDTHTVAVTATPTLSVSGGTSAPAGLAAALTGALTASLDEAGHRIGYGFAAADGLFDFLAAGQTLTATYDLAISDGRGGTAHVPVAVTVTGTNDAPVAQDATLQVPASHVLSGSVTATDVDAQTLTYAVGRGPAHGSLSLSADGRFTYTADAGYHGNDSFTYTAGDTVLVSEAATVTLVGTNSAPVIISGGDAAATLTAAPTGELTGGLTPQSQAGRDALTTAGHLVNGLGGAAGFGASALGVDDDNSSDVIDIRGAFGQQGLNFFGTYYTSLYVNNNGNITFGGPSGDYTLNQITSGTAAIIAPFFADVDTRAAAGVTTPGGTSTGSDRVYYDLDTANGVLTVTWDDVGRYYEYAQSPNAFQVQLVSLGGGDFDIVYRYEALNWTTGDVSGDVQAVAGYAAGNGVDYYQIQPPGGDATRLTAGSNVGKAGLYVFQASDGTVTANPTLHATGGIGFTDADAGDTHTATSHLRDAGLATSTGAALPKDTLRALETALSAAVSQESDAGSAGTVTWSFTLANDAAAFLHAGESLTATYDVTVGDGDAATSTAVSVTIQGVDDPPTPGGGRAITALSGGSVVLGTADLGATDPDSTADQLVYTVTGTPQGTFTLASAHGFARYAAATTAGVTSFTQADIDAGRVTYHAGSTSETVALTLGDGTSSVAASLAVTVTGPPPNAPPHWATDASGPETMTASPGAGGLAGLVYQIGGYEPTTVLTGHDTAWGAADATFTAARIDYGNQFPDGNLLGNFLNWNGTDGSTLSGHAADPIDRTYIEIKGYFHQVAGQSYDLFLESDDGAAMYLDGSRVILNDGLHNVSGSTYSYTAAATGYVPIEIDYFEHEGDAALRAGVNGQPFSADQVIRTLPVPLTASTTLRFTDADTGDTHRVEIGQPTAVWSAGGVDTPLYASSLDAAAAATVADALAHALGATLADGAGSGAVTLDFTADPGTFAFLGAGESLTASYDVTVRDDRGYGAVRVVDFTIAGANDAPVVSVGPADNAGAGYLIQVPDSPDAPPPAVSGTLTVTDADLHDAVALTSTLNRYLLVNGFGGPQGTLTQEQQDGLASLFQVSYGTAELPGTITGGGSAGDVTWTFDFGSGDFGWVSGDETLTLSYGVHASDGRATGDGVVTIQIAGRNSAPVIAAGDGTDGYAYEQEDGTAKASGTLAFTDANWDDRHSVGPVPTLDESTVRWLKEDGTLVATDMTLDPAVMSALAHAATASLDYDSGWGGTGQVSWSVSLPDETLAFLGMGETLTATYDVAVDDGHGAQAVQAVTVTFTGTNDAPVVEAVSDESGIDSAGTATPLLALSGTGSGSFGRLAFAAVAAPTGLSTSGTLTATDADLTDTVTITTRLHGYDGPTGPLSVDALASYFSASPQTVVRGGSAHDVAWSFDSGSQGFQYLSANEILTLSYDVVATDTSRASSDGVVTIKIHGRSANPVIEFTGGTTATRHVDAESGAVSDTASGTLLFTDANWDDTHAVGPKPNLEAGTVKWFKANGTQDLNLSADVMEALDGAAQASLVKDTAGWDAGLLDWSVSVPDTVLAFLGAGETLSATYDVSLFDNNYGYASRAIPVTFTGVNDAPVLALDTSGPHEMTAGPVGTAIRSGALSGLVYAIGQYTSTTVNTGHAYLAAGGTPDATFVATKVDYSNQISGGNVLGNFLNWNGGTDGSSLSADADASLDKTYIEIKGYFKQISGQNYDFYLKSDDGAAMYVNGTKIIDLDGAHNSYSNSYTYHASSTGYVPIEIDYFQVNGSAVLQASVNTFDLSGALVARNVPVYATSTAKLTFTDADLHDTHTVTLSAPTATWSWGALSSLGSTVETQLDDALSHALSSSRADSTNNGSGSVTLKFQPADGAFAFLAAGESLTASYGVTVTDGHDPSETQTVTFIVDGANAAPVIDAVAGSTGAAAERAGSTGSAALDTASGTLSFTDANWTDTHHVDAAPTLEAGSVSWLTASGIKAGDPTTVAGLMSALAGAATAAPAGDSTGGLTGHVTWSVSVPDSALDFLGAGETLTAKYDVTVSDDHGGSAVRPVTVTFTGANDAPQLVNHALTVDQGQVITLSSADLSTRDPDASTSASQLVYVAASSARGYFTRGDSGVSIYSFTQAQVDAGQIVYHNDGTTPVGGHVNVTGTVSDGTAGVAVTLNLTIAANKPPVARGDHTIEVAPGGSTVLTHADLVADDPDHTSGVPTYVVPQNIPGGYFTLDGGTTHVTAFTQEQIDAGRIAYHENAFVIVPTSGVESISFKLYDGLHAYTDDTLTVRLNAAAQFQTAAAGGVHAEAAISGETRLVQQQLDLVVAAAISEWAAAGASAAQIAALTAATYTVTDLPDATLGEATPGHVAIDINADGIGWYLDPTPGRTAVFAHAADGDGNDLFTDPSQPAAGHFDLLTTVAHEMGHILGLADETLPGMSGDLMYEDLVIGERRLPTAADVAATTSPGAATAVAHQAAGRPSAAGSGHADPAAPATARLDHAAAADAAGTDRAGADRSHPGGQAGASQTDDHHASSAAQPSVPDHPAAVTASVAQPVAPANSAALPTVDAGSAAVKAPGGVDQPASPAPGREATRSDPASATDHHASTDAKPGAAGITADAKTAAPTPASPGPAATDKAASADHGAILAPASDAQTQAGAKVMPTLSQADHATDAHDTFAFSQVASAKPSSGQGSQQPVPSQALDPAASHAGADLGHAEPAQPPGAGTAAVGASDPAGTHVDPHVTALWDGHVAQITLQSQHP